MKKESTEHTKIELVTQFPLCSFVLFAYNQEKFIREAIEGALAQTYSPLEIILSDDCSQDSTFDIMQEMAAKYRGPHTVRLNRNPENLGLGNHINVVFQIMRSDFLIGAAGDDISLPDRAECTIRAFLEDSNRKSISTYIRIFGDKSELHWPYVIERKQSIPEICWNIKVAHGCSTSYHRSVFTEFGPLLENLRNEDVPLLFRSLVIGTHHVVPNTLVLHRSHSDSITQNANSDRLLKSAAARVTGWNQILSDLKVLFKRKSFMYYFSSLPIALRLRVDSILAKTPKPSPSQKTEMFFFTRILCFGSIFRLFSLRDFCFRKKKLFAGKSLYPPDQALQK